ncbi:hypothetical protein RRF57_009729 [Xylaria bambusicola]|uniref:Uncharacterized protein n=1 Tax=Xylaria bambusicola TaxID=326684 RepID=A0AAN7UK41_9PEZI
MEGTSEFFDNSDKIGDTIWPFIEDLDPTLATDAFPNKQMLGCDFDSTRVFTGQRITELDDMIEIGDAVQCTASQTVTINDTAENHVIDQADIWKQWTTLSEGSEGQLDWETHDNILRMDFTNEKNAILPDETETEERLQYGLHSHQVLTSQSVTELYDTVDRSDVPCATPSQNGAIKDTAEIHSTSQPMVWERHSTGSEVERNFETIGSAVGTQFNSEPPVTIQAEGERFEGPFHDYSGPDDDTLGCLWWEFDGYI